MPQFDVEDSIGSMAETVLALGEGTFSLVGHSMGGYVALEVMRRAPGRVERLALLSTQPRADSAEQADRRRAIVHEAERGRFSAVVAAFPALAFHGSRLGDSALVEAFDEMARRVGPDAFLRQQRAIMGRVDSTPGLPAIAHPTLVLCGRQDQVTPLGNSELMAASIPDATLTVVEDCGHMAPMERPTAITAALFEWLGAR